MVVASLDVEPMIVDEDADVDAGLKTRGVLLLWVDCAEYALEFGLGRVAVSCRMVATVESWAGGGEREGDDKGDEGVSEVVDDCKSASMKPVTPLLIEGGSGRLMK